MMDVSGHGSNNWIGCSTHSFSCFSGGRQNAFGAILGTVTGCIIGVITWLSVTSIEYGQVNLARHLGVEELTPLRTSANPPTATIPMSPCLRNPLHFSTTFSIPTNPFLSLFTPP